jgi:hypothetical protein
MLDTLQIAIGFAPAVIVPMREGRIAEMWMNPSTQHVSSSRRYP